MIDGGNLLVFRSLSYLTELWNIIMSNLYIAYQGGKFCIAMLLSGKLAVRYGKSPFFMEQKRIFK